MSAYWTKTRVETIGTVDFSGSNAAAIVAREPWDVKRIVGVVTVGSTGSTATKITVQRIPLPTGTSNPVSLGVFEIPSGLAEGKVFYFDLGEPANVSGTALSGHPSDARTFDSSPGMGALSVGNQIRVVSDGGADAGTAIFMAEYAYEGLSGKRFNGVKMARAS